VTINDKHIEVIVRQMLQKVEITDAGDTELLNGEQVDRSNFDEINERPSTMRGKRRPGRPGSARYHQGVAADPLVHLGRVLPGDHPRPYRSRGQRQGGHAGASRKTSSSAV
jgi:hypothetical protein